MKLGELITLYKKMMSNEGGFLAPVQSRVCRSSKLSTFKGRYPPLGKNTKTAIPLAKGVKGFVYKEQELTWSKYLD